MWRVSTQPVGPASTPLTEGAGTKNREDIPREVASRRVGVASITRKGDILMKMKRAVLLGIVALLPLAAEGDGAITSDERTYLLDQLEQSKEGVLASISGLTQSQWRFKPAPNVWSVQECGENITLAEDFICGGVQQILKSPGVDRPANSNAEYDRKLTVGVQDRSRKATAPEPITPTAKFATPADAAREFTARRDKTIAYAKTTNGEMRVHVCPGPAGPMDAYQCLLLIAAHSARHTAQITEVHRNPPHPKPSAAR